MYVCVRRDGNAREKCTYTSFLIITTLPSELFSVLGVLTRNPKYTMVSQDHPSCYWPLNAGHMYLPVSSTQRAQSPVSCRQPNCYNLGGLKCVRGRTLRNSIPQPGQSLELSGHVATNQTLCKGEARKYSKGLFPQALTCLSHGNLSLGRILVKFPKGDTSLHCLVAVMRKMLITKCN